MSAFSWQPGPPHPNFTAQHMGPSSISSSANVSHLVSHNRWHPEFFRGMCSWEGVLISLVSIFHGIPPRAPPGPPTVEVLALSRTGRLPWEGKLLKLVLLPLAWKYLHAPNMNCACHPMLLKQKRASDSQKKNQAWSDTNKKQLIRDSKHIYSDVCSTVLFPGKCISHRVYLPCNVNLLLCQCA